MDIDSPEFSSIEGSGDPHGSEDSKVRLVSATIRYSRRPQDVATARRYLVEVARGSMDPLPTYGEVAKTYGGIARAVAPILNSIARECSQAGEPDLSALVVDASTRLAGSFAGMPVEPGTASELRWRTELDHIRAHVWTG